MLTSPTVATVGLGLTIPLAMMSDALLEKEFPTWMESTGAIFVLIGFFVVSINGNESGRIESSLGAECTGHLNLATQLSRIGNIMKGTFVSHPLSQSDRFESESTIIEMT